MKRQKTFKRFFSTLLRFDEDLDCFVASEKWRDKEAELLTAAWWMFAEVATAQPVPESFEQAYSEIFSPIVKQPYPRLENGDYKYIEIDQGWKLWQAAAAQAVPEGFVLVPEDQAKDTDRLNFLLGGEKYIRTVIHRDIQNDEYEKIGEHFQLTEVFWIDGFDYWENTSSDSERGAIDKAMIGAQEPAND